ncbi:MAG: hypothetical protein EBZ49_02945 [Proteobacteria bacterium]|nr:hypothetical protein [Pseudomonadota bacterium]
MRKLLEFIKRVGSLVFAISQKILLASTLFFLYFFVFSWFSLFAKLIGKRKLEKERIGADSFWLKPALENPSADTFFKQS